LEVKDVAASLNIKPAEIRKLENGNDFNNRDAIAQFLQSFYCYLKIPNLRIMLLYTKNRRVMFWLILC